MVRFRVYFIIIFILTAIYAFILGGNLPFFMFFTLLFILILTYSYMLVVKHFINLDVIFHEDYLYAGDKASCTTIVSCGVDIPLPYVEIKSSAFISALTQYSGQVFEITTQENKWIMNDITFYKRGIYKLGKVQINVMDLFKIAYFKTERDAEVNKTVYPRIYDIERLPSGGKDIYKDAIDVKGNNEDQFVIKDVRKYRQGDSLKRIHWKLSAKYNELFVKNSENISGEEFVLFIDMNSDNNELDELGCIEENIIDTSVSIVKFLRKRDIDTKVFINCSYPLVLDIKSNEDFNKMLDYFVMQRSDGQMEFSQFIQENCCKVHRLNKLAAVSARLTERLTKNIIDIKNSGYSILMVYCSDFAEAAEQQEKLKLRGIDCCSSKELLGAGSLNYD